MLSLFKGIDFGDEGFIAKSLKHRVSTDVENNFHFCKEVKVAQINYTVNI